MIEDNINNIDINKVNHIPINAYKLNTLCDLNFFLSTNTDKQYKFGEISDCADIKIVLNLKKIGFVRDLFFKPFKNIAMGVRLKLLTNNINIVDGVLYLDDAKFIREQIVSVFGKTLEYEKFQFKKISDDYLNTFSQKIKKFIEKINVIKLIVSNNSTKLQFMECSNTKTYVLKCIPIYCIFIFCLR